MTPRILKTFALLAGLCVLVPGVTAQEINLQGDSYINGQELKQLSGDSLTAAFAGKTHHGTYKTTRERTGTNQFREITAADGTTRYKEGDMELSGTWRVIDDRICYQYDSDLVTGVHCFNIFEAGTCLYGYDPSIIGPNGPLNANFWSVKSLRKGDISTCDDLIG